MSKYGGYRLDGERPHPRSDGSAGGSDGDGPLWRQVDGLLQKGFPAQPADEKSRYPDPMYYLPYIPELELDSDLRITPPVVDANWLAPVYTIDVGKLVKGVGATVPWDLRHLPVSRNDVDSTIEASIVATRINSSNVGELRWSRKYFLLVKRVDGDREPNTSVLMLGSKQANELCTQLALHRKYVKDLVGTPMRIVSVNGTLSVDLEPDSPRLDMSMLSSVDEDGELLLDKYLWTVRDQFEQFLLQHGYTCELSDDGRRYSWRLPSSASESAPLWDTRGDTVSEKPANDEFEDYTKEQLREVIDAAGLSVSTRATREQMIAAIADAK